MKNQKNSLVSSLILVAFVLVASLVTLQAQQYYTNSTPPNGYPQGYSAGYSQPLAPSQTLGNQVEFSDPNRRVVSVGTSQGTQVKISVVTRLRASPIQYFLWSEQ